MLVQSSALLEMPGIVDGLFKVRSVLQVHPQDASLPRGRYLFLDALPALDLGIQRSRREYNLGLHNDVAERLGRPVGHDLGQLFETGGSKGRTARYAPKHEVAAALLSLSCHPLRGESPVTSSPGWLLLVDLPFPTVQFRWLVLQPSEVNSKITSLCRSSSCAGKGDGVERIRSKNEGTFTQTSTLFMEAL